MVRIDIPFFNLRKICQSGQVFRMYEREGGVFDIYSADRHVRASVVMPASKEQKADGNWENYAQTLEFDCTQAEFDSYWFRYFDIGRDYEQIVKMAEGAGSFIRDSRDYGCSIRILNQDIWEMMISFIISQQKQIPSIRRCVEALCERYGEKRRKILSGGEELTWYTFPTPQAIAAGGTSGLGGLSLGYRERYIYETSVQYIERGIPDSELMAMDYAEAKKYLLSFTGIGEKVANCILLFGAGFADAFPIDTHIKDILYREFYLPEAEKAVKAGNAAESVLPQAKLTMCDYERLTAEYFDRFRPCRGIVQQWIFAYEISQ